MKERLNDMPNWFINLVSLISGVVTIATPIFSAIIIFLNPTKLDVNGFLLTITIMFGAFCVLLFFRAKKYRNLSSKRMYALSNNYHKFLHTSRNVYYEVMRCRKGGKLNVTTLSAIYKGKLTEMLNNLCDIMISMTGREVSACIKLVSPSHTSGSLDDCSLVTFCRSSNSKTTRSEYDGTFQVTIKDNTDFETIVHNESADNAFYASDLLEVDKHYRSVGKQYKNSNLNWSEYYKGTIVVPIRIKLKRLVGMPESENYDVLGFVCVDSLSTDAFTKKQRECNVNIMHSFSDAIYVLLGQYMHYMRKLEEIEAVK